MRNVIAHLIRGEAEEFHIQTTRDLTQKFDCFPLHERTVPHLTLKRWFELDEKRMEELYKIIDDFARSHPQSNYTLKGYGNFREDIIYIDVQSSAQMREAIKDLYKSLHTIEGLTFDEFDTGEELHATVAMSALKPFNYEQIWNYLTRGKKPDFDMKFDNIAILKKPTDKWIIDRVWELGL